jgi:Ca-activated chloride channel family protein
MFPLPPSAAVSNFRMRVGGKEVAGEILEKGKAREIYEQIVRQSRDPGLLEYVDRGLFRASVFPIPPRGGVDVTIEYSETWPRERGMTQYRYPLDTGKYSAGDYRDVVLDLKLRSSQPIRAIHCPSHDVAIARQGEREARVSLEAKTLRADKDLILVWNVSEEALAPAVIAHRGHEREGFFFLAIAPRAQGRHLRHRHLGEHDRRQDRAGEEGAALLRERPQRRRPLQHHRLLDRGQALPGRAGRGQRREPPAGGEVHR